MNMKRIEKKKIIKILLFSKTIFFLKRYSILYSIDINHWKIDL